MQKSKIAATQSSNIINVLATLSPDETLQQTITMLRNTIPEITHAFYLIIQGTKCHPLVESNDTNYQSAFAKIMGFPLEKLQVPFDQTPKLQQAAKTGKPFRIPPAQLSQMTSGLIKPAQAEALKNALHYQSMHFYPLRHAQHPLGFWVLLVDAETLPSEAQTTLQHMSTLAANALHIVQLTRELETSHSQMAALHAVSLRVSHSLDIVRVMEQAVEEVTRVLEVEAAAISAIEIETRDLVIRAQRGLHAFAHAPVRIPKGKGLAWETLQTKQHLIIDSWEDEPRLAVPEFREERVSTTILVPMLTGGESIGVLSAMSRVPRPFTDAEVKLLSSIADHVAIALKKAYLHEEARRQAQERAFLFNLAAAIVPLQDVESIASEALNRTLNFLGWSIGVFLIEDSTSNALVPKARIGDSDTLQILISRTRETAYQQNILHPVSINHTQTPPRTVVQIPIHARYHTLGWLILGTPEATDIIPQTQETLTTASNYLGIAVENVQLYQEMTEREKSTRALYQITRAMAGHNLPEMLKQTLEELHNGIAYEVGGILLSEPQHIEMMRLRVALPPEKLADIRAHLRNSLGTLGNHAQIGAEDTQIIIRGQEAGTLNTDTLLSYLEVPIIQESEPLGVILLARQHPFRARDQRLLFILAYQLSKVLATIRLFHQAQEQTRQLEETNTLLRAQESSQAEILNDVAQELRTPITFIQSYAELLYEEVSSKLSPSQQQALNILQEQAGTLSRLVRDLGIMKTITSQNLQSRQTNLVQLLKHAVDVAQITATEKQQNLNLALAPNTPTLRVAPEHIRQVIDILLNNAIKFTPQGGSILISTLHHNEQQLRIAVTNPGPDVTQGKLNLIFERLHQGQLGRKYPGIGVGLTLAQRIVTAHNGSIGVDYSEGQGNTFYFTLPKGP